MNHDKLWDRRTVLQTAGATFLGTLAGSQSGADEGAPKGKGNVKQSICRWCYSKIPLGTLASEAKKMGYQSIELLTPPEFPVVKEAGLTCAILGGVNEMGRIAVRWRTQNRIALWDGQRQPAPSLRCPPDNAAWPSPLCAPPPVRGERREPPSSGCERRHAIEHQA